MTSTQIAAGAPTRGPGRPRTEGHDERIIAAALALIDRGEPVTVSAVVARSGVSRAALYRRWPSMTELMAAALDHGRADGALDLAAPDIKKVIVDAYFGDPRSARGTGYTERRFRKRLALVMDNPDLQQAYWSSHVKRRRVAVMAAFEEAVRRGELRDDLDLDACIDAVNGVFYYQSVVRGASIGDPDTLSRCRAAFEVLWRGMRA